MKPAFENEARSYATGSRGGGAIAVADFNNDGFLDLAYGDFPDPFYVVMLGDRTGSFVSSHSYALPSNSNALATADFDGDGKLDLITDANQGFRVLRGQGDGTFEPPRVISIEHTAHSLAVGDFNGDGRPDVVIQRVQGFTTGIVNFYFGDGHGGFVPGGQDIPAPSYLSALLVADLDRDGRDDVLVWSSSASSFSIIYGASSLPFSTPLSLPVGTMIGITAADFNQDGQIDIAVSDDQHRLALYFGSGNRRFRDPVYRAAPIGSLAAGDFNGDGHMDLAIAGRWGSLNALGRFVLEVLTGSGDGSFSVADYPGWVGEMRVVDLNRDGTDDIIFNPGYSIDVVLSGPIGLRLTPTLPTFYQATTFLQGDFNGDGHADLFVSSEPYNLQAAGSQIFFGDGSGHFQSGPAFSMASSLLQVATGRFRSGGATGLIVGDYKSLAFYRFDGQGSLILDSMPTNIGPFSDMAVGDLNGDGLDDVVLSHPSDHTLEIRLTLRAGGLGPPSYLPVGDFTRIPTLADFDGDGKVDLFFGDGTSMMVSVFLGDGKGGFQTPIVQSVGVDPLRLLVADFNADGRPDLAIFVPPTGAPYRNRLEIHRGDGTGAVGPTIATLDLAFGHPPRVLDVNGDGFPDVVTAEPLTIFVNDGGNSFEPGVVLWGGMNREQRFVVGDFNEDGKPDLASNSYYEDAIVLLMNARCVPASLQFVTALSGCTVASPMIQPAPVVEVTDSGGNVLDCAQGSVTATLLTALAPPGATLGGITTVDLVGGRATFPDLLVAPAGPGYRIQFSAPNLSSVRTDAFETRPSASACRSLVHRSTSVKNIDPRQPR